MDTGRKLVPLFRGKSERVPRFIFLLLSILADLMLAPLFGRSDFGLDAARILTGLVLVAELLAAGARRTTLLLFIPVIAVHLLGASWGGTPVQLAAVSLRVVFFGYATGLIVWYILRRPEVTTDTIAGAACAYTLLAMMWGNLYMLLEILHPGSFAIPPAWRAGAAGHPDGALLYFSFITLTTTGYGDI